jgi:hypothetical protein
MKGNKQMKIHTYLAVRTATRTLAACAALALICVTGISQFANAAGGGTGGGTMFYIHLCCRTMWTMNSDGTSQTQLGLGTYGPVSTQLYNGHRWFMDTRPIDPPEYYPNGDLRVEVFALRDDYDQNTNNNSATRVQLTNDITFQTYGEGTFSLHLVPGGQKISMIGRRWSGSTILDGGIFTASLQFGPDGNITGLAAQPGTPAIPFTLNSSGWTEVRSYDWDPTGTKIAYDNSSALWMADTIGSPHSIIYNGLSHVPAWSHDGKKIAFTTFSLGISTIGPDGKGYKQILRPTSSYTYDRVFWSPGDTNIVCYGYATATGDLDIFRADSNGNFLTNLTNTPSTPEYTMGWR